MESQQPDDIARQDPLRPQCQCDRELHHMRVPVFDIMTGTHAEFISRERYSVPAQRLDISVEGLRILSSMQAEIVQDPSRLPVAQG